MILLARSEEFREVMRDIIGNLGLRAASAKIDVSAAYMGTIKDGTIPSDAVLAKIVAAFEVQGELAERFWRAAQGGKPELELESIVHFACDADRIVEVRRR